MIPRGSVALVTGGAKRLGRAIALRLARGGCRVAVHYRGSRKEAEGVVREIRTKGGEAKAFAADLARAGAPARLVRSVEKGLGPVAVLVNNASVFRRKPFRESSAADLEAHWAVNLRAPYLLALAAAPGMQRRGAGKVVNLGDIHGEVPLGGYPAYCISKAGLLMMTRALARELAPGVQVNAVSPGTVLPPDGFPPKRAARLEGRIPAGRFGTPGEIAEAVAFFVEGPDFVTGQVLRVDGGRMLRA